MRAAAHQPQQQLAAAPAAAGCVVRGVALAVAFARPRLLQVLFPCSPGATYQGGGRGRLAANSVAGTLPGFRSEVGTRAEVGTWREGVVGGLRGCGRRGVA